MAHCTGCTNSRRTWRPENSKAHQLRDAVLCLCGRLICRGGRALRSRAGWAKPRPVEAGPQHHDAVAAKSVEQALAARSFRTSLRPNLARTCSSHLLRMGRSDLAQPATLAPPKPTARPPSPSNPPRPAPAQFCDRDRAVCMRHGQRACPKPKGCAKEDGKRRNTHRTHTQHTAGLARKHAHDSHGVAANYDHRKKNLTAPARRHATLSLQSVAASGLMTQRTSRRLTSSICTRGAPLQGAIRRQRGQQLGVASQLGPPSSNPKRRGPERLQDICRTLRC